MTTPVSIGDGNSLLAATKDDNDENALPVTTVVTLTSPKSPKSSANDNFKNLTIDTKRSNCLITHPHQRGQQQQQVDSRNPAEDPTGVVIDSLTQDSSLVFSSTATSDNFTIDDFPSVDNYDLGVGTTSLESSSIERSDTDRLEGMMAKFDNAQKKDTFDDEDLLAPPTVSETPKALHQMMDKFDLLKNSSIDEPEQDKMMARFDQLQQSAIQSPKTAGLTKEDDAVRYRDKRLFEVLSPACSNGEEGIEVGKNPTLSYSASYSTTTDDNDNDNDSMFSDIEQFRSAESHFEHDGKQLPAALSRTAPSSAATAAALSIVDARTQTAYEQRILTLANQVSKLELEKDELQSKVRVQHNQDVEDMYQNPYSDPFASTSPKKAASPTTTTSGGGGGLFGISNPFLDAAKKNLLKNDEMPATTPKGTIESVASVGETPSAISATISALHTELTELRRKNQTLTSNLETSDRVKQHLKKVLKTVQGIDKQKTELINKMKMEVIETRQREKHLKNELNDCKVRLEGFEMAAQGSPRNNNDEEKKSEQGDSSTANSPSKSTRSIGSNHRRSFFSSGNSPKKQQVQTGDVATALVVSQKQNEALEAFNKELEIQNANLQKKCDGLNQKYGLKAPEVSDAKGTQLYSRYLEMKSSLSSLSVVLEEAQEKNTDLRKRVTELETELSQEEQGKKEEEFTNVDSIQKALFQHSGSETESDVATKSSFGSQKSITLEQEEALNVLVEKLKVQIVDYRDAEERHGVLRAELESAVDKLEKEAAELREKLEKSKLNTEKQSPSTDHSSEAGLEVSYAELEAKIAMEKKNIELNAELESLKAAMDAAALESTRLLNELESKLATTREELSSQRAKYKELESKHKALLKIAARDRRENTKKESDGDDSSRSSGGTANSNDERLSQEVKKSEKLLEENEKLNEAISSFEEQTKKLKAELEQKTTKIEKSEKRVTAKHEKLLQLTQANASLRDGIHKLREHLSLISEQASKTEESLIATKHELTIEHEHKEKLKIANSSMETKIGVLQKSIEGSNTKESSEKIQLGASLAASQKELSLEKERVKQLSKSKKELENELDHTKADLETQLHTEKQKNSRLGTEISGMEKELYGTKLAVAASVVKMGKLDEINKMHNAKLREVLNSTRALTKESIKLNEGLKNTKELLSAERNKVDALRAIKTSLESRLKATKQSFEELQSSNLALQVEIETMKDKSDESSRQFSELEKLLATTQEELNGEESQVESLEQQVDDLSEQISEHEIGKRNFEVAIDDLKVELQTVTDKNGELESLIARHNEMEESIYGSPDDDEKEVGADDTKKIETLLQNLKSVESENAQLKSSLATLEQEKKTLKENEENTDDLKTANSANTASTDIRVWESEMLLGNTKRELSDSLKLNEALAGKVKNLESSVEKSQQTNAQTLKESETHVQINKEMNEKILSLEKIVTTLHEEKDGLMKRTATLARRDQIQKASIATSNEEISVLMQTITDFQKRFESLAAQVELGQEEKIFQMKHFEEQEIKYIAERGELKESIAKLQKECDEIRKKYNDLDSKHMQILMKEQSDWQSERVELNTRIASLEKNIFDEGNDYAQPASYALRQCPTDRSLLNQMVGELEQDIQLLEVTMNDKKQEHLVATAELEVAQYKLSACEEELEECKQEMQSLVLKTAIDREAYQSRIRELVEKTETLTATLTETKTDRDALSHEHDETKTALDASKKEVKDCLQTIIDKSKRIEEFECKVKKASEDSNAAAKREMGLQMDHFACMKELECSKAAMESFNTTKAIELQTSIDKFLELTSKYDSCRKELDSCKVELKENEEVMKELAKKQVVTEQGTVDRIKHNACLKELKELKPKYDSSRKELASCLKELKSSNEALEDFNTAKAAELRTAIAKQQVLQSKYDSCRKELDSCKLQLIDNHGVVAKVEHKNKNALVLLTDDLNEAHIREKALEDTLKASREELLSCKKKLESAGKQVCEEQYGAGVYKDVIAKLNKSNDDLTAKNKELAEKTEVLKESEVSLQTEVGRLEQEISIARVVAGANSAIRDDNCSATSDSERAEVERQNVMMENLLAQTQLSVTEAKNMQKILSNQVEAASKREAKLTNDILLLKASNADMEKRLEEQELELDEFESDFALARNDARKVVEELRSQLSQLEKRNKQLESASGAMASIEDLLKKLKQLVHKNKKLQKEIETCRVRERRLESELGLEPRRCR